MNRQFPVSRMCRGLPLCAIFELTISVGRLGRPVRRAERRLRRAVLAGRTGRGDVLVRGRARAGAGRARVRVRAGRVPGGALGVRGGLVHPRGAGVRRRAAL